MSDLSTKFAELETLLAGQAVTMGAYVDTVEAKLQSVLDNLDTIIINNAVNAKYLAAAILAADQCQTCPPPSTVVPPVETTPGAIDEDRCKRAQAFLQTMSAIFAALQGIIDFDVPATTSIVSAAYDTVISGIVAGDTVPLPSFAETVNVAGDTLSFAASRLFSGENISELFAGLLLDLRDAIYFTTDPTSAKSSYDAIVTGSSASATAKLLLSAAAYNALYSYYFDPASTPDLTGFDGSVCSGGLGDITACTIFSSEPFTTTDDKLFYILHIPPAYGPFPVATAGDYFGWTFEEMTGTPGKAMAVYYWDTSDTLHLLDARQVGEGAILLNAHSHAIIVQTLDFNDDAHPFTCRICPPA